MFGVSIWVNEKSSYPVFSRMLWKQYLGLLQFVFSLVVVYNFVAFSADGLLNITELDPIRRYLPAAERPRPNSRYSSFQVSHYER